MSNWRNNKNYRIKEITEDKFGEQMVIFTNGDVLSYDHEQDCCEHNYADFAQLDDLARNYQFIGPLEFEIVDGSGFRFGDSRRTFFVPCYSEQNGYYSSYLEIYLNNKRVAGLTCEEDTYI